MASADIPDDYFTKKHRRLHNIAKAARIFAWIYLVLYMINTVISFKEFIEILIYAFGESDFVEFLSYLIQQSINVTQYFVIGIAGWLVLRGISSGLNMIIETSLNYKDQELGEDDE